MVGGFIYCDGTGIKEHAPILHEELDCPLCAALEATHKIGADAMQIIAQKDVAIENLEGEKAALEKIVRDLDIQLEDVKSGTLIYLGHKP